MQIFRHLWNHGNAASRDTKWTEDMGTLYQFTDINDIDGNKFDFNTLKGKVVLFSNVACGCGYTKKGYEHMVQWKTDLANDPFEIVAWPSNSFDQETKDETSIKKYVTEKFGLNFPLMQKGDVKGENTNPVYQWLYKSFPGEVTWNFSSYFLVNHEGIPIARFEKESWDEIKSGIDAAVEAAKQSAPAAAATPAAAPVVAATPPPSAAPVETPAAATAAAPVETTPAEEKPTDVAQ